jgi:flagellar protein FliS
MFHRASPWQAYRQVVTQTASPGQLVLLLYDGAIRFLEQARIGFSKEDPKEFNEAINNNILRAQAILDEMNQALNMEEGGDFAANMRKLYNYMDARLQESNVAKAEEGITDVIRRLTIVRDAWAEMLRSGGAASAAAASANLAVAPISGT